MRTPFVLIWLHAEGTHVHKINPALHNLAVPLHALQPDPHNARQRDERAVLAIMKSYETHGQQKPIIANDDGVVLAGNGQLEAARRLGWEAIAVVVFSGEEPKAFALADNKTGDLSEWNLPNLAATLGELPSEMWELAGFEDYEVQPLLETQWPPAEAPPPPDPAAATAEGLDPAAPSKTGTHTITLSQEQWELWLSYRERFDITPTSSHALALMELLGNLP